MRKKQIDIIMICSKCGKEPDINKEMSNENWRVVDNKPCKYCGGKLKIEVITNSSTLEGEQSEHLSTNKENKN